MVNDFNNEFLYFIMFGLDKCGVMNKVYFIFWYKNLNSGKYVEYYLKNLFIFVGDKLFYVYIVVIYFNNIVKILIDGEEKKIVDLLLEDFEFVVILLKIIVDLEDKKFEDWDDCVKILDFDVMKFDDWDEDVFREIEDVEVEKLEVLFVVLVFVMYRMRGLF